MVLGMSQPSSIDSPRPRYQPGEITLKRKKKEDLIPTGEGDGGFFELPVVEPPQGVNARGKRPDWLRVRLPYGETYRAVQDIIDTHQLHTVCQSARCPNMGECWSAGTATFMILGNVCTRSCGFCAVMTGRPAPDLDWDEPRRVADAVRLMGLRHAVVTSVNRDERKDGGAPIFAETIRKIREVQPGCTVEVLIPDFRGNWDALQLVLRERPGVALGGGTVTGMSLAAVASVLPAVVAPGVGVAVTGETLQVEMEQLLHVHNLPFNARRRCPAVCAPPWGGQSV